MSESIFKKSQIITNFSKLNKIIYGWPKSGKTTFAAQQVDDDGRQPLFIATEDGHHAIDVYVQRITGWEGFLKLIEIIKKNQKNVQENHSCFVLDLVTDLDIMCQEYVAEKMKVSHLADLEFGKGFARHGQEFSKALRELMNVLPCTFIAHSQEKELKWNNEKVRVQAPSMSKRALEYVNGKVDLIAWINPANSKRAKPELCMRNSLTSIAGSRYPQLVGSWTLDTSDMSRTYHDIQEVFAGRKGELLVNDTEDTVPPPTTKVESHQEGSLQ